MLLKQLYLKNFRSVTENSFDFTTGPNVFIGPNGCGKTTILEAISLLTLGKSFRTMYLNELIQWTSSYFILKGSFLKNGVEHTVEIRYSKKEKSITFNETSLPSFTPILSQFPSVFYVPSANEIIHSSPEARRKLLNVLLIQSDPLYTFHYSKYVKALQQRNTLLKKRLVNDLLYWDTILVDSGTYLINKRKYHANFLNEALESLQTSSPLPELYSLAYAPNQQPDELLSSLKRQQQKDLIMGYTSVGPHRDDLSLFANKKPAKQFVSEGQKRSLVSLLKMAEWHHLAKISHLSPILCIDDFGVHLDKQRQAHFHDVFNEASQSFITTTDTNLIPKNSNTIRITKCS